ncbi:MAG: hypothetical protein H7259_04840 [Cytophagales bacterium]|nr:hypothetical protein [Cytophaga sp.]
MDKIVKESCSCADNVSDTLQTEERNMQLGLCMINAAMPYKKQLKKDYDIDMDKIETEGEKIGRFFGLKMASVCPNVLMKMSQGAKEKEASSEVKSIKGIITAIESDFFVTFSLKDNTGKVTKFYWLTFIESEIELVDSYKTMMGRSVEIQYEAQDFYDPKIQDYRLFNVILQLELF